MTSGTLQEVGPHPEATDADRWCLNRNPEGHDEHHLQPAQALDASYVATSRVIAAISSATELATGDAVFISLERRVNMAQYEAGLMEEVGIQAASGL